MQRLFLTIFFAIGCAYTINAQVGSVTNEFDSLQKQAKEFYKQDKYAEALPIAKQAVENAEKTFGKESKQVIQSLYLLASIHLSLWDATKSEPLLKRAIKSSEKVPDLTKFDTVNILDKLGECYEELDKESEAEKYYREALEVREKKLSSTHSDIALSYSNLARVLTRLSKYKEAEPFFKKAIEIKEKSHDNNQVDLAETLDGYACLLKRTERKDEAFRTFDRVNELLYKNAVDKSAPLEIPFNTFSCRYMSSSPLKDAPRPVLGSGKVLLLVLTDEAGKVIQARAISGVAKMFSMAEQMALRANFKPAIIGGKPIKMMGKYSFRFETRTEIYSIGSGRLGQ